MLRISIISSSKIKKKNIILVLATGRGLTSMSYIKNVHVFDYLIGGTGAFIYDIKKQIFLYKNLLTISESKKLIEQISIAGLEWSVECEKTMVFSDSINRKQVFLKKMAESGYKISFSKTINFEIPRILVNSNSLNVKMVYETLKKTIDLKQWKIYKSFTVCEITRINTNKWTATKKLLDILKIRDNQVIAIGDSANDYELLKNAGFAIAMGNAQSKIKKISNLVTKDVSSSGWHYAFKKIGVIND